MLMRKFCREVCKALDTGFFCCESFRLVICSGMHKEIGSLDKDRKFCIFLICL